MKPTRDPHSGRFVPTVQLLERTPTEQWLDLEISDATWAQLYAEDALPLESPIKVASFGILQESGW